mgnify:CR=1 FL=1
MSDTSINNEVRDRNRSAADPNNTAVFLLNRSPSSQLEFNTSAPSGAPDIKQ